MADRRPHRSSCLLATAAIATAALGGCGTSSSSGAATTDASLGGDATSDAPVGTLRIEPPTFALTTNLATGAATSAAVHVFERVGGAPEVDVTSSVTVAIDGVGVATYASATGVMAGAHGGTATLTATATDGAIATAPVVVTLIGDVFPAGTTTAAATATITAFAAATLDADPTQAPAVEYPIDQVVVPSNVPPMEAQWTSTGDSTTYRVHLLGPTLDVHFYAASGAHELLPVASDWAAVLASAAGTTPALTVEGIGATGLHVSASARVTVARDAIDDSAITYWESSSGSLRVIDLATASNSVLPVTGSAYAPGGAQCVACHTVSRDGKRIAYDSNFALGALSTQAGADAGTYAPTIEPNDGKVASTRHWTYGAFNPSEATTTPALLVTNADINAQNTAGHVHLSLLDPDTGATVPSNLDAWLAAFPSGMGPDLLMPDWTAGGFIVFAAYDSETVNPDASSGSPAKAYVRDLGDDAVATSIVEAPIAWDASGKSFTVGPPKFLVHAPLGASLDVTETDTLPQISPDDAYVAFTRSQGWWSLRYQADPLDYTSRIAVVRRADSTVMELTQASGPPKSFSTWPQWAPTVGTDYLWVAFSSERSYGHRMAPGVSLPASCFPQGHSLCKNIWVAAVSRTALASGTADPSMVPFWLPGQTPTASAVSPRWSLKPDVIH